MNNRRLIHMASKDFSYGTPSRTSCDATYENRDATGMARTPDENKNVNHPGHYTWLKEAAGIEAIAPST